MQICVPNQFKAIDPWRQTVRQTKIVSPWALHCREILGAHGSSGDDTVAVVTVVAPRRAPLMGGSVGLGNRDKAD